MVPQKALQSLNFPLYEDELTRPLCFVVVDCICYCYSGRRVCLHLSSASLKGDLNFAPATSNQGLRLKSSSWVSLVWVLLQWWHHHEGRLFLYQRHDVFQDDQSHPC